MAVSRKISPTAPLTDAEGKFLYHLVLSGGITGGSRVGIERIFTSSKRELLDDELALVDSKGRRSGKRTPNTGKGNYISEPMIKRMAAQLKKRYWASEDSTHQDLPYVSHEHSGYMLNGESYITTVLSAKIAFALQAWALNHSMPEIAPDPFIAQICQEPGITRQAVVKKLEWLREQRYITECPASSSPHICVGKKIEDQKHYIRRLAARPLPVGPFTLFDSSEADLPNEPLGDLVKTPPKLDSFPGNELSRFSQEASPDPPIPKLSERPYARFYQLLGELARGEDCDQEDLRIVTTSFSSGLPDIRSIVEELLRRHVRIKILILDSAEEEILDARNRLRSMPGGDKYTTVEAIANCVRQFDGLKELEAYPGTIKKCSGKLEVLRYNTMPPGFYAHTNEWALLGLYWAKRSYSGGPFIEADTETGLWKSLKDDWDARWAEASKMAAQNS